MDGPAGLQDYKDLYGTMVDTARSCRRRLQLLRRGRHTVPALQGAQARARPAQSPVAAHLLHTSLRSALGAPETASLLQVLLVVLLRRPEDGRTLALCVDHPSLWQFGMLAREDGARLLQLLLGVRLCAT